MGLVDPLAIDSPEENSNLTRTCILPLRTNKKTEVPKTECPFDKPLTLEETNIVKQMGEDFFRLCTGSGGTVMLAHSKSMSNYSLQVYSRNVYAL